MNTFTGDKRNSPRWKKEVIVGIKARSEINIAYTIDVSRSGVKVGSPLRHLPVGETVELVMENRGEKYPFAGKVVRDDGTCYINRIRRSVHSFYIRIDDTSFTNFIVDNYYV